MRAAARCAPRRLLCAPRRLIRHVAQLEKQKAIFNELVSHVTELCFNKCVPKPGSKLDSGETQCLSSCTMRFLETTQVVVQRMQRAK